jgi:hypothetical protein
VSDACRKIHLAEATLADQAVGSITQVRLGAFDHLARLEKAIIARTRNVQGPRRARRRRPGIVGHREVAKPNHLASLLDDNGRRLRLSMLGELDGPRAC